MQRFYLIELIKALFNLTILLIIVRSLLSWFRGSYKPNRLTHFIHDATDPLLNFFKKIIPPMGMMDFSPLVAVIVLDLLRDLVIYLLSFF